MDSKEEPNADDRRHSTANENSDTVAMQKKRARRVSFAENTSVHFFDRDEELNETPLKQTAKFGQNSPGESGFDRELVLNKEEFGGDYDGNDNEEDEEAELRGSFFHPVGSPSPGGSTFGSASSNDEDNFFGPVSANFIRPGRLSDSAASDDNYDLTMDSTAFSMHYRSLARSESGVDLKTPTGGQFFSEEKTQPGVDIGSSMIFTLGKKPIAESSMPVSEVTGSHNSNDMSIVGDKSDKYDYEKLSPGLVAILAGDGNDFLDVSVLDGVITSPLPKRNESKVPLSVDQGDNHVNLSESVRKETDLVNSLNLLNGDESAACSEFGGANGPHETSSSGPSPERFSSNALVTSASDIDNHKSNRSPYLSSKNESEIPLVASTSSPVKQQQILRTTASPLNYSAVASPLPEKPGSILRNEIVEHQEAQTSIRKSISKLDLLEKSAFPSTFRAKVDSSAVKSLDFLKSPNVVEHQEAQTSIQKSISKLDLLEKSALSSTFRAKVNSSTVKSLDFLKSPNVDMSFERNPHISRINLVEDSIIGERLASVRQSKNYAFSTDRARAENLNHTSGENHSEAQLAQIMSGKLPNVMSAKNISADQLRYVGPAVSPSKITWSGNNLMRSLFTSKLSNEDVLLAETESLLDEIASGEGGKTILTPKSTSAGRMLGTKLSASPSLQSSHSRHLLLQSPLKQISTFDKVRDSIPVRNLAGVNLSDTAISGAESKGMVVELSSPFVEANDVKNLIEAKSMGNKEVGICNGKEIFGTIENFSTPAKENKLLFVQSKNLDESNITSNDISRYEDNLPEREPSAIFHSSVSPSACRNFDEPRLQKNVAESPTANSSRKELGYEQSSGLPFPQITQLSGRLENFSANKRNIEVLLRDAQHRIEMSVMQRSHKLQRPGNYNLETVLYPNEGRTTLTGHEKKWTDIYSKFLEDIENLFSRLTDQLNLKMIDVLEDVLVHQQRSKIYEMLHLGVMQQNTTVLLDIQLEKIAETNSVLQQVVFKKAKLQLKHVKRERLLKRLQLLNSRIQESQVMKEDIVSKSLKTCTNVLVDAVGDRLSVNLKKGHEVCHEKLSTMRQDLEALDGKILHLTRTLQACCKMKAEPSCANTIALVNEHLLKRASFRFLRQDLQMWMIQRVDTVNGQSNLVLSYLDFVIQSIKITGGPTSSVTTSFQLNEMKIIKNFPNMDACIAFAFVFNAERACNFVGAKTLVREMQVTSSLLGTLLDVVEEVQAAQMEFQNLTQSSFFCSPSVDRLDLMLCFLNFKSGSKVSLTLDMSSLKCGIYPSEILPLQLALPVGSHNCSPSKPIFDQITDAVKGVRPGYMRVLQLCRCVSQVVQASTS